MATKLIDKQYSRQEDGDKYVCTFICDTAADAAKLQTEHPNCCPGSKAVVADTGEVWMVNASGKWVAVPNATILALNTEV